MGLKNVGKRLKNTAKSTMDLANDVKEKGLKDATKDVLKDNLKDVSIGKAALGYVTCGMSLAFTGIKKEGTTKAEKEAIAQREEYLNNLVLSDCIVDDPKIAMDNDEICYYKGDATSIYSRKGVVGYTGGGASFKVSKNLKIGGMNKKTKRDTIVDEYPGTLYITNKRFILMASKHSFNIKFNDVQSIKCDNTLVQIYRNNVCNEFLSNEVDLILRIIKLMGDSAKEELEKINEKESNDPYEELKKLKELLDMNIITQEEFDTKKKELLNL